MRDLHLSFANMMSRINKQGYSSSAQTGKPALNIPGLDDSKKLTDKRRRELFPIIKEQAIAYGIAFASHEEIDEINILNASFLAMHRAVEQLKIKPEFLLIDGNRFNPYKDIKHQCIVGGDAKYQAIAAASILAKVARDHAMLELD